MPRPTRYLKPLRLGWQNNREPRMQGKAKLDGKKQIEEDLGQKLAGLKLGASKDSSLWNLPL